MKPVAKHKSSLAQLKQHRWLTAVGIVLVLFLVLFIFRGWVRMTAMPAGTEVLYGNSVEETYQDEMSKLQNPLAMLGYAAAEPTAHGCHTMLANGLKTQIDCQYEVKLTQTIDDNSESKQKLNANAEKLQTLLKQNGWQGEYANDGQPYTSLVKLVSSITSGIDYQPDATYSKRVGNTQCFLQNYTAFSQPDPPAMSAHVSCYRTVNILGQPSWN
jgi:hypothetical protein